MDATDAKSATATATVTVTAVNDAPSAGALGVSTTEDTALTFAATDFTGVFSDPDSSDSLKAVNVLTLPSSTAGLLALDGTAVTANQKVAHGDLGDLVFTPVANWNGEVSFTFKVADQSDAESAAAATATITVTSVADAPVATDLTKSTAEDTALTFAAADFQGVYTDGDGDGLKAVQVTTLPAAAQGALALGGSAVTVNQEIVRGSLGTLKFTPAANWNGDATFGFKVVDTTDAKSAAATATVTVTAVNDAPSAGALGVSTTEDTALTFAATDFEGAFSDPDSDSGDSLKAVKVVTLPATTAGSLALDGTAVSANQKVAHGDLGDLVFTPVADWNGEASFTFKVADQSDAESAAAATATITVTAVADAPVATDLTKSTAEDTALTFAAAEFDGVYRDADGDTLKAVQVTTLPAAAQGALALGGTAVTVNQKIAHGSLGTLKFTPAANWNGDATFGFKVVDTTDAKSATATATVTVTAVNDAPSAGALRVSTTEDTTLTFAATDFEEAFSDPDSDSGDSLKAVKVVTLPSSTAGSLALNGTAVSANQKIVKADLGTLVFTPVADWNGEASFTFKVADQSDEESAAAATATITVTSVADAPVATDLTKSTAEDTALTFAAADFQGVYTDGDGDGLKAVQVTTLPAAAQGALALGGSAVTVNQEIVRGSLGTLKFTPAANWNGDATFGFKVVDTTDAKSAAATATVTVTAVNDAPTAGALGVSTTEDTALTFTAAQFEGVFRDPDSSDSLKAVKVVTLPAAGHGSLALDGTAVTANQNVAYADLGDLVFTPVADWNGEASFTFKVADQADAESAAAATATITVTSVADTPVASDLTKSTAEDTTLTFAAADFQGVYTDGDGDGLKAVQVTTLPAAAQGALKLGANAVTVNQEIARGSLGTLKFTPAANYAGDTTFEFKVVDATDAKSAAATATITVTAVNDAPSARALNVSTDEDTALTFAATDFEGVFRDPDASDNLRAIKVVTRPASTAGSLALNGTAVSANQKIVKDDLGTLVFTPVANWNGEASFTFKVADQSDAESAAAARATITVTAVADAPVATDLTKSTAEDTVLTFAAADFDGVYTDADADSLKAVQVTSLPDAEHGALALGASAVTAKQEIARGSLGTLKFTPAANWNGDATFEFKVVDATDAKSAAATATITVGGTNDAPSASALRVSTTEDTALTFTATDFEGVFSDPDSDSGDSLKAVKVVTLPASAAGSLALDGTAVSANQKIVKADLGDLVFTPVANWNGEASFTFNVADQSDAESATATATITVTAVADAPVASDLTKSTAEDTVLTFAAADFDGVYTDGDDDGLKAVQVTTLPAAAQGALAFGTTAVTANQKVARGSLGTLKFTPAANWNGNATFGFKVVDATDAKSAAATATITVTSVNDAPSASALNVSTTEDTALTFTAAQFEGVFRDADASDSLKAVKVVTLPASTAGSLALDRTAVSANQKVAHGDLGDLVFTPEADWNGQASFTFKVGDQADADSATATATITVTAVADAPSASALNKSTAEDTALTFAAADFDGVYTDADRDTLKAVQVTTLPAAAQGALALGATAVTANQEIARGSLGTLKFTPAANYAGDATFKFKLVDATDAKSATATATITVTAVNDAPSASALGVSTNEDTALTFAATDFTGVFGDPDSSDSLKAVKVVTLPASTAGLLALNGTAVSANQTIVKADLGTLVFTPAADWNGEARFAFKVADQADAESATATATITVTAVADAPVASDLTKSTAEDTALTFAAADFDGVFRDPDGDGLKAVQVSTLPAAAQGALALGGTAVTADQKVARGSLGTLKFTPAANYAGNATFEFKLVDATDAVSTAATATITVGGENDAPSASALNLSTAEDTALTFTAANFAGVFSDPDSGDSLKAVKVVTLPDAGHGKLALNGTAVSANQTIVKADLGDLVFTPEADWNGDASFTFKVADQSDAESAAAATATITVTAVADAPAATDLTKSTAEDTVLTFAAADFDGVYTDGDGDSLKAVKVMNLTDAGQGALALNGTAVSAGDVIARDDVGSLKFTPAANFAGDAEFTFQLADQSDRLSATAMATITVTAVPDAPTATALAASTDEDTVLTFAAADFDGVFSDVDDGDSLKAVKVMSLTDAAHGELALDGTAVSANQKVARGDLGDLTFTPVADWNGEASFTFKLADQSDRLSATATATITVTAVADAPLLMSLDLNDPDANALAVRTAEDTALTFTAADFDGVFRDVDDGDSLKAVKVVTLPDAGHGKLALDGTAVSADQKVAHGDLGDLKFTPVANWNGEASFTFKVIDQSDAESATASAGITVTPVADAPTASALNLSTAEDTALTFTAANFEGAFRDVDDGDSLKAVQVVTLPDAGHGELALDGTAVSANQEIEHGDLGDLVFTPVANWNGEASFTFKVTDQADEESAAAATATITVTSAADAPVASDLTKSTDEDTALTFAAADFDGVYTDGDGDSLKAVQVTALPAAGQGALTLGGTAVTVNQEIARGSLGTLKFTPAANFAGNATFEFKLVDATDVKSTAATATITVGGTNDAPSASALGVSTTEDTALTFTAAQFEGVFRDPDADDSLKAVKVVTLPATSAGLLALDETAVTANQKVAHGDLGDLVFTPVADWNGEASFTFKVADQSDAESADAATATITVTAVADEPVASDLTKSTAEDTALTFAAADFDGVFTDGDGDGLKAVQVTTLPAASQGALALGTTAVTASQKIARGSLGTLKFTPTADYAGNATFEFKVVDATDEASSSATATITVTAVNDAPSAGALAVSTNEDTALTFAATDFTGVFSDPDSSDSLRAVKVVTLPATSAGSLALNGTAVTANQKIVKADLGTLKFTPVANWNGQASFTFKVADQSDAESADAATATITVTAVADAPSASALNVSTTEDTALTFTAANFDGVFSDPDSSDSLKAVKVVTLPAAGHGELALSGTAVSANQKIVKADLGTLKFTPVANWNGQATFTFKVVDQADAESADAATATATVTVTAVNDAPTASALNVSTTEDTALTFTAANFDGVFGDPDASDSLKAVKVTGLPATRQGALTLGANAVSANQQIARGDLGTLKFTPAADYAGDATFEFKVVDQSDAASVAATATVTVTAVNDTPSASALNVSTAEDTALTFTAANFEGAFSDPDASDSLKAVKVTSLPAAAAGSLALSGTAVTANQTITHGALGNLVFTPVANWHGQATFEFKVTDQSDAESADAATATVTVTSVNDAPTAGALSLSTTEETVLTFTAANFEGVFGDGDSDDSLKAVKVISLPAAAGSLALGGTAVSANQQIAHADLGTLKFTPVANYAGQATFEFKVVDQSDAESSAATATITVGGTNDAPTASALNVNTAEDTALTFTAANFEGSYSDADASDSLKAVKVTSLPAAAAGSLALNGTAVTANQKIAHGSLGNLVFTPVANWHGQATFEFKVVDQSDAESADAATATVTVTSVADAPAAGALAVSTAEDTALTFTAANFEGVFSDGDSDDSLKAVKVVSLPDAEHGALALSGTGVATDQVIPKADLGTLTFTPQADWAGQATFGFQVSDPTDRLSATATATVTVTAAADAPSASALGVSTAEDTALTFTAANFEEVFDDPDDGDTLKKVQVITLPDAAHGALALNGTTVTAVTANQKIALGDLGKLTFTPVANWNGAARFTFKMEDKTGAASTAVTATVTVTAVADAPTAGALAVSTEEDTALTFTAANFEDVFSDPDDGDSLKKVQVITLPDAAHGVLALNGTAVTAKQEIAHGDLGTLTFTPVADWNGDATFDFKVVDQTDAASAKATATVTVTSVDDAPNTRRRGENPKGPGEDPEASVLEVSTTEDTVLEFTAANFEGVFSDQDDDDSLKAVIVQSLPDAGHGVLMLQRATELTATAVTARQKILHQDLGGLTFTPAANWHGKATFDFKLVDQTNVESEAAKATVTVTAVNDAPAASALNLGTTSDAVLTFTAANFEGTFSDVDTGDSLKAVKVVSLPAATVGALALSGETATAVTANQEIAHGDLGTLTFTPVAGVTGSATFTFQVLDQSDAASADATATITVTDPNDDPIAPGQIPDQWATQGAPFTYTASADVFSDPDGDPLVWKATVRSEDSGAQGDSGGLPDWLTFDADSRTFGGTPAAADLGTSTIRVTATDPEGAFAYAEFDLTVLPPVQVSVTGPAQPVAEGVTAAFTLALSRAATADVTVRWATVEGSGEDAATAGSDYTAQAETAVTFTAGQTERIVAVATLVDDEDEDAETFAVQLSATAGDLPAGVELGTSSATATIVDAPPAPPAAPPADDSPTVVPTNAPPVAGQIPDQTAIESVPFSYTVPAGVFYDPDGDPLVIDAVRGDGTALPQWLTFSGATFAGTPGAADVGAIAIRVTAIDPSGAFAYAEFTLTVLPRALVRVSGQAEPVTEGTPAFFTVALSRVVADTVTVRWETVADSGEGAAAAGSDYEAQAATELTFAAGQTERTVAVATLDDPVVEGDETFMVQLSAAVDALPAGVALDADASSAGAVIADDDAATISLAAPEPVREGEAAAIVIVLSQPVARPVTVLWATVEDSGARAATAESDYEAQAATELTFAAGQTERTVAVATLDDPVVEGDETFSVGLSVAAGGLPARVTLDEGAGSAGVVIADDDAATVSVAPPEPVGEGESAAIVIVLSQPVARPVTVLWATAEDSGSGAAVAGSDYVAQTATELTFAAGQTERTVAVATLDDPVVEGDETFSVRLSAPDGLPAGVTLDAAASSARVVIEDDDEATISLAAPEPVREGESAVLEIVLSQPVARAVIVHCATVDGTATAAGGDYEAHAAVPLAFAPGVTRQTVQVATYADYLVEGTETFLLRLGAPPQRTLPDRVNLGPEAEVMIEDNLRPVADAGPDQVVDPLAAVVLDGTASYDPDGDPITSYAWKQTAGLEVTLSDEHGVVSGFTAPYLPGPMTFELLVRDDHLESLPDAVTITVRDVAPVFLERVADQTFMEEREIEPLTLPAAAGGNGGPFTYELTSAPAGLAGLTFDPATRVLSGTPRRSRDLTFTYVAHDADANRELSDAAVLTFTVTVQDAPYRRILRPVLAAFGRATLEDARNTIGARSAPAADSVATLMVAGQPVPFGAAAVLADAEWPRAVERDHGGDLGGLPASVDELLSGSAFELPLLAAAPAALELTSAGGASGTPLRWTLWGRGSQHGFRGKPEADASYQGDLRTAWLGLEANPTGESWLAGVALSHSLQGTAEYTVEGGDQPGERGRVEVVMTGVYPYARWEPTAGSEISALLGAGRGTGLHERDGVARESSDLTLLLGAVGLRQALSAPDGWLRVAVRGDAGFARVTTGRGLQALDELTADAGNARLGVEAALHLPLGDAALRPFAEVAARYDGGHDVTGAGLEVAGGLSLALARFELEARGRWLALHSAAGQAEHGVSVTARLLPDSAGLGLSLALSPNWGAAAAGSGELWQDALPHLGGALQPATLEGTLGYGFALPGSAAGVLTPFANLGLSEDAGRRLRLGTRLEIAPAAGDGSMALEIGVERNETAEAAPEHRADLDLGLRY